jgi:hypothetical protein
MRSRALGLSLVLATACACPSKPSTATNAPPAAGSAAGAMAGSAAAAESAVSCESVRAKADALYRDEAQHKEPKRVDEAVADNVAMVMRDCAADPAKVAPCVAAAASAAAVEKSCLAPLDAEGTEGDKL